MLDCQLHLTSEGRARTWIGPLFRSPYGHSPLQHLLLIQFVEQTPETFFAYQPFATRKPFGDGPWPCLNTVADHCGELIVEQLNVQSHRADKAKLIGTFVCACASSTHEGGQIERTMTATGSILSGPMVQRGTKRYAQCGAMTQW